VSFSAPGCTPLRGKSARFLLEARCVQRADRHDWEIDILPALKGEDSSSSGGDAQGFAGFAAGVPASTTLPTGVLGLVFARVLPLRGFYADEATAYPRRSHMVSTGVTSGLPGPRCLPHQAARSGEDMKRPMLKVYNANSLRDNSLCAPHVVDTGIEHASTTVLISPP
jgi:hypothetical protein